MDVSALHAHVPAARAFRRLLLLATVTLIAVIFGMLAMHTVTTTASAEPIVSQTQVVIDQTSSVAVNTGLTASNDSASPVVASSCAGMCELNCLVFGLMCTVGTMAAVLTLLLYQRSSPRVLSAALMRVSVLVAQHVALLRPPSLFVLSISRT